MFAQEDVNKLLFFPSFTKMLIFNGESTFLFQIFFRLSTNTYFELFWKIFLILAESSILNIEHFHFNILFQKQKNNLMFFKKNWDEKQKRECQCRATQRYWVTKIVDARFLAWWFEIVTFFWHFRNEKLVHQTISFGGASEITPPAHQAQ